jgi:hypothetical protein
VITLAPTTVRIVGDTVDVPIALKNDDLTLTVNDKVLLAKAGRRDGWVIVCVIGVTS